MKYIIPDKLYIFLKWVCMIALNAIGVLYATLAHLWGWPYGVEIPATLEAIAVCIGVLIGVSAATAKPVANDEYYMAPVFEDDPDIPTDDGSFKVLTKEEAKAVFEDADQS